MAVKAGRCKALIKDYCTNCSFAGIHFIADDTKHFLERLLWLVLVILSWYGSALLIVAAWDAFVTSPISFGVETTYLNWETKMPAVAVCETINKKSVYNVSDTIWPPNGHLLDLEDALRDIAYFRGWSYALVDNCYSTKTPDPMCLNSNYRHYADLVRSDCRQMMRSCSYNDNEFDCCEYFQPIETDIGVCFILNSVQTQKPNPYPMISNRINNKALLKFEVILYCTVYTLQEDEVPTITTLKSSTLPIQLGSNYRRQLSIRKVENDPRIVETTTEQRACRFHTENENGVYPHYSYSACTVLCRKKGQVDMCGCNDHFMLGTNESEHCDLSGIACLHKYTNYLTILRPEWAQRPGLSCNCLPSCDETEITVIKDVISSMKGKANKKKAQVEVMLAYLATERFKRSVVRSRLDLVDLLKLDFHKDQAVRLKSLVQQSDFPHLLVYGHSGAGKKTRIMCLLRELYGSGVERLRQETMNFTTPSNKKIEIMTVSSNYHIEVNPTDVGIYDRVVIMDLVKNGLMSVGGTTGLFVGASILSFVELIFFFTVRFISNILMEKRKINDVIPISVAPA